MRRFCFWAIVLLPCLVFSCNRPAGVEAKDPNIVEIQPGTPPLAILQAGEYPLWFQFTGDGPVLIESIEDACFSTALIPWPLAPHIRFILARSDELLMAVNRDGFLRLAPRKQGENNAERTGLYRFSGGEFWQQYTVGAFILFDTQPAALLYLDDRFLDTEAPVPLPRLWTFDPLLIGPQALSIPSLEAFVQEEGWDVDALRRGSNGRWYFRAVKKTSQPEIRMLRSDDLTEAGEQVSLGEFQNSALPESLSAAAEPLRELLSTALDRSGCGIAAVVSPEFQSTRFFAIDKEKDPIFVFYSSQPNSLSSRAFLFALQSDGTAMFIEAGTSSPSVREFSLPSLPEGFIYTGIGIVANTIFASWEEQNGYSIGAAGFMVIRL
jgi:hypothetical protein